MTKSRHNPALELPILLVALVLAFHPSSLSAAVTADVDSRPDKNQMRVDERQKSAEITRQEGILRKLHDADLNGRIPVSYRPVKPSSAPRPETPPTLLLSPFERQLRTGKSRLVLQTEFLTKDDAYAFVSKLVDSKHYDIDTYDSYYSWFETDWHLIPTPKDWMKPYSPNQFRIHFDFDRYKGGVRVVIRAHWRESLLSDKAEELFFQPDPSYSTSYAWNVLEHLASQIPNVDISFE